MSQQEGRDYIVAVVIATEVPPTPTLKFTAAMIPLAIRCVADVIRNRVDAGGYGETAVEVVLAPKQFSAVCREDYWRRAMAGRWFPKHVENCLTRWKLDTGVREPAGATHYYSPISMIPQGKVPDWVTGKTEVIVPGLDRDYFRFYR